MQQTAQPQQQALDSYLEQVWNEVLVPICGVPQIHDDKYVFIDAHAREQPAREWRFQGNFGFGGKFRMDRDFSGKVDMYPEDETPERVRQRDAANEALVQLFNKHQSALAR